MNSTPPELPVVPEEDDDADDEEPVRIAFEELTNDLVTNRTEFFTRLYALPMGIWHSLSPLIKDIDRFKPQLSTLEGSIELNRGDWDFDANSYVMLSKYPGEEDWFVICFFSQYYMFTNFAIHSGVYFFDECD